MADGSVEIDVKLNDSKAKSDASKAGKDIAKGIESGMKSASSAAKNTESQIKSAMSGVASSTKSSFTDVGSAAKSGFGNVSDAAKSASSEASSSFNNIAADSKGSFSNVSEAARDGFSGVSDAAEQTGEQVEESLGFKTVFAGNLAADAVQEVAKQLMEVISASIEVGMAFDKSMSQVAATMGVTTDQIGELRDFAKEMGAQTAFSATQASDALNFMALAGYDAETSMRVLPTVLNLAAAGNMDLALASDMVTDAQSALGLSVEQAEIMVDQMAKTSSKTNTSVSQLGDAFLTVGGTAKNLKGGTAELAQVLGILADNGIKGAQGGTALRNIILSLSAPTDTAKEKIEELGLAVFDAEGNMRSMPDIMNDLNAAMEPLTQQQKTEALNTIFNKVDLKSVNALLGTSADRFDEVAVAIDNAQGSAKQMAETQLDNLAGDVTLLQSAAEGLAIQVSDVLAPSMRAATQFATSVIIPALSVIVDNFGALATAVVAYIAIIVLYNRHMKAMTTHTVQMGKVVNIMGKEVKITGTAFKVATVASKAFSTAMKALKAALPLIALTLAMEAVFALADAFGKAQEDAKTFSKATDGLVDAFDNVDDSILSTNDALNKLSTEKAQTSMSSLKDRIKESIDAQAELAGEIADKWGEINANSQLVDMYMLTIDRLTGKYQENNDATRLTKEEQEKLAVAIAGINELTGSNIEIIDAETGKLSESTDAIKANADAWLDNAKKKAAQEELLGLAKQQIENEKELSEATTAYSKAKELQNNAINNGIPLTQEELRLIAESETAYDQALEKYNTNAEAQEILAGKLTETNDALKSSAEQLKTYISLNADWVTALAETGVNVDEFSAKLSELGFSTSDLTRLGENGAEAMRIFAQSIAENGNLPPEQARIVLDAIVLELNGGNVQDAARQLGHDIDEGLKAGIEGSAEMPAGAAGIMSQQTIDKAKETFQSNSPSKVMEQLGNDIDLGLGIGIDGKASDPINAMKTVGEQVKNSVSGLPGDAQTIGSNTSSSFAGGVGANAGSARTSGNQVASEARGGMQSENDNASTWGSHLVQNFASGIGAAIDWVVGAATNVANAAKSILGFSVPEDGPFSGAEKGGELSGRHLVQNFAKGMLSGKSEVEEAADELMGAVEDSLSPWDTVVDTGEGIAKGLVLGYDRVDPAGQIVASMGAVMSMMAAGSTTNTTNNNTTNWYLEKSIATPDELFRAQRMNELYGGLAARSGR